MPVSISNAGYSSKFGPRSGIQAVSGSVGPSGVDTAISKGGNIGASFFSNLQTTSGPVTPMTIFVAMIVGLLLLKFVGELEKTAIRPSHISVGFYNSIVLWLYVTILIAAGKYVFNRYPLPGITPLVNAT